MFSTLISKKIMPYFQIETAEVRDRVGLERESRLVRTVLLFLDMVKMLLVLSEDAADISENVKV